MLCPEVWNFPYSKNNISVEKGQFSKKSEQFLEKLINKHPFNETLSIIIAEEESIPEEIVSIINSSFYYIIKDFKLTDLIRKDFIEAFIKRGNLTALNTIKFNEIDDIFAVTPDGILILSINKDLYQSIGLDGRPHKSFSRKKDRFIYLNLSTLSGGWKTEDMEPIVLNGLVDMKNLHTLILTYDCTDNILKLLETACPRIQVLDISSSKLIGNNSIKYLLELNHLRKVQLYRTSITIDGYIRLLTKMPQLEDIGRYDAIGACLEYIDMTYEYVDDKPVIKLKSFHSHYVVAKHLKLLAKWCPDIEIVCLFHNPLLNDLMTLVDLNKLSELRLLSGMFFQDHLRDILEVKGCNITYLHLEHVDEIDINALMCISQYCPDLTTLIIYNCELFDSRLKYFKKTIPPFMNLERLTIAASCTLQHLEFLLMNCFKIKFIHIGTMSPTNDELFDRILANNPMEYLEELHIIYSTGLTVSTAYKLIETCENLSILNELENWTRVQEIELDNFRLFLKTRNYNIDTRPLTWKPQIGEENN